MPWPPLAARRGSAEAKLPEQAADDGGSVASEAASAAASEAASAAASEDEGEGREGGAEEEEWRSVRLEEKDMSRIRSKCPSVVREMLTARRGQGAFARTCAGARGGADAGVRARCAAPKAWITWEAARAIMCGWAGYKMIQVRRVDAGGAGSGPAAEEDSAEEPEEDSEEAEDAEVGSGDA